ncbi:MAG: nuclear transport factor 2 family protein [Nevskia sp.]|nr:nuclear transport factor 2 family protein [Nevskia sp.]
MVKSKWWWLAAAWLALAAQAAPAPDNLPGPVAAVQAFHAALKAGDSAAALKLLAADVTIYEQGFVDAGRDAYGGPHLASDTAFAQGTDYQVQDRRLIWLGDSAACVLSTTHIRGRFQGQPIDLLGTETALLRQAGGNWTIEHLHWSAHPGETPTEPAATPPAAGDKH